MCTSYKLLFFSSAETVADPASTTRDNQDTMSGEAPSDVTTKDPFQDMTEQAFTDDYEDTTHSQAMDEEEGKTATHTHSEIYIKRIYGMIKTIFICVCVCVFVQGCWDQEPSQPLL